MAILCYANSGIIALQEVKFLVKCAEMGFSDFVHANILSEKILFHLVMTILLFNRTSFSLTKNWCNKR